jgi:hypothetical protein
MLKKIVNNIKTKIKLNFNNFQNKINSEQLTFKAEVEIVREKLELIELIENYFAHDIDSEDSIIKMIYKVVNRDTQFSLRDITDKDLKNALQKYILERDFN